MLLRSLVLVAALALGVASSSGVRAQECEKPNAVILAAMMMYGPAQVTMHQDVEAARVLSAWNATDPVSDDKADTVYILRAPGFKPGMVGVVFVLEGCVSIHGVIEEKLIVGGRPVTRPSERGA